MPCVYQYWCEPASHEDNDKLLRQLYLASEHYRQIIEVRNRRRALARAMGKMPEEERAAWNQQFNVAQLVVEKQLRKQIVAAGLYWGTYTLVEEDATRGATERATEDATRGALGRIAEALRQAQNNLGRENEL